MNIIKKQAEILHTGDDWNRVYLVKGDIDFNNVSAICKVRDENDNLLIEANCTVEENKIYVSIPSSKSISLSRSIDKGYYDVFITNGSYYHKIVMGSIKFYHNISLH